jgi:hypothetical protein
MRGRFVIAMLAVLAALAIPAAAFAGALTLHPAGFGEHSYSAWKAHQGEPDSKGSDDQALYFQKMTSTATFAAGAAVIKGVAGLRADELTGLAWDHREDGHCGAGAPRWNINLQDAAGNPYTVFLGCNAAQHTQKGMFSGHGWCRDTQPSPAAAIQAATGRSAASLTLTSLVILFDEGTDTPNPPPAGCAQESLAPGGFVYLDNIEVTTANPAYGTKCWTGANDNSNQSTGPCTDPPSSSGLGLSTTALSPLSGLAIDPLDSELASSLTTAVSGTTLSDWLLYPYVY